MEALLAALAACLGSTVAEILDAMHIPFRRIEVFARGVERSDSPRVFEFISVGVVFSGAPCEKAERAASPAESKYCPVSAILRESGARMDVVARVSKRGTNPQTRRARKIP